VSKLREGEPTTEGGQSIQAAPSIRRDALIGTTLDGRFEIKRMIARGGMGKIYEAIQQPLGRSVAIKVMDLGYSAELDPDFAKRFFLEASTSARLSHPNTVRIFDYGQVGDVYYIVMELLVGETLLSLINREAPLAPLRVIHVCRQIAASLSEAHKMGIVHRDLKPSNVLLTKHGDTRDFTKVLDFGLAKVIQRDGEITRSGLFLGSPNYMSPEQIRSNQVDQRSDIYSLGVLLFMCLTGRSPFKRETQVNILVAQLEDAPPWFDEVMDDPLPPGSLEWIVRTCLAKKAEERFATVAELTRALSAVELELRGQLPPLELALDQGRTVLPPHAIELLQDGYVPRPIGAAIPPVPSAGSLVRDRVRRVDQVPQLEPEPTQKLPPKPEPEPEPAAPAAPPRRRRKPPPKQSKAPLVLALLACAGAAVALGLVLWKTLQPAETAAPELPPELPMAIPGGVPDEPKAPSTAPSRAIIESEPDPPAARPAAAPRPSRAAAQPASPRPAARPASTPAPVPVQTGAEPTPTPAPAATPATLKKPKSSDLRDPWAD
jgi:serine/threonine protein kinase